MPSHLPIIAIDGPAGAGKSTVTKLVAARLGLLFLDTGAMYRAIAWLVLEANLALDDELNIARLTNEAKIVLIDANSFESTWMGYADGKPAGAMGAVLKRQAGE